MPNDISTNDAVAIIKQGGIIAYPTEAVFGLGCSPFNKDAVKRLLKLKGRQEKKGLILLISNFAQLNELIKPIDAQKLNKVKKTWPGHNTWIFSKSPMVPAWISGEHQSIAIRMSNHPIANALCREQPIVSTSANMAGQSAIKTIAQIKTEFPTIDGVIDGPLGTEAAPSKMFDALTGERLR